MPESSACLLSKSVLFVDDEEAVCEVMRDYLELLFADVYTARDGEEGLELFARYRCNIVITDIKMPRMDGLAMARAILALHPEAAIMVVSAYTENRFLHDALNLGIRHYEYKPIDLAMLQGKLEQVCEHQELLYRLRLSQNVIDNTHDAVVIMDAHFQIAHVNSAFEAVSGYSKARAIGKPLGFVLSRESQNSLLLEEMEQRIMRERKWQEKLWCRHKNGHRYPVWMTMSVVEDERHGKSFIALFSDISVLEAQEEQLQHIAYHDALTDLPNRNLLLQLLEQEMLHVRRSGEMLALFFIDLDGFKEINDRYGHKAGDYVLKETARRIRETLRASDITARLGGDEFVAVLSQLQMLDEVEPLLARLLGRIEEPIAYEHQQLCVTASIGISSFDRTMRIGTEALVHQADQAMYEAKQQGKNRYHFFDAETSQRISRQNELLRYMYGALEEDGFILLYQPQVDMKSSSVIGFEALLRWVCPGEKLCEPELFLPWITMHESLMQQIDWWVFEQACRQLRQWEPLQRKLTLSINVTAHFFHIPHLPSRLMERMEHYALHPSCLELEMPETISIADFQASVRVLEELRSLGFKIAIDDFGTGYASLEYMKQINVDTIKIDKSFVLGLFKTRKNLAVIEATVALSHAFMCRVVAEGVESEEQGRLLLSFGCTKAQGFWIAQPMNAETTEAFVQGYEGFDAWRSIEPLQPADRSVLHARIEHGIWFDQFVCYMRNESETLPLMNQHTCYFGAWLLCDDAQRFADDPAFKAIETMHALLHQKADDMLERSEHPNDEALELLIAQSEELMRAVDSLIASPDAKTSS
ncbi:MAG: EAL domain-containing protein [Campylobacterales bacterium]|nr:EAL domain-containing protein [Campylobacterales bacterium]